MNARTAPTAAAAACLLVTCGALADWTPTADFSSCPRKYYPQLIGRDPPVATESECKARIEQAKRGDAAVCIRYSCVEGAGGSDAASASAGHELDSSIEQAISAGVSGQISGGDAAGLVGLGILGNALLAGMSPEEQEQARQQAEARRQQVAEQQRQRAAQEEERKNRLLGEMQGVDTGTELGLMTDDAAASSGAAGSGGGGELALMTDDDARGIMGKRKPPTTIRNQPPATRINPGPYSPGAKPPQAGAVPAAPRNEQVAAMGRPADAPQAPPAPEPESFNRGILEGRACTPRNPGFCASLKGDAFERCRKNYDDGYNRGQRELEQDLVRKGTAAGQRDRATDPTRNVALANPEARGSCGHIFIQAYNNAFR